MESRACKLSPYVSHGPTECGQKPSWPCVQLSRPSRVSAVRGKAHLTETWVTSDRPSRERLEAIPGCRSLPGDSLSCSSGIPMSSPPQIAAGFRLDFHKTSDFRNQDRTAKSEYNW